MGYDVCETWAASPAYKLTMRKRTHHVRARSRNDRLGMGLDHYSALCRLAFGRRGRVRDRALARVGYASGFTLWQTDPRGFHQSPADYKNIFDPDAI